MIENLIKNQKKMTKKCKFCANIAIEHVQTFKQQTKSTARKKIIETKGENVIEKCCTKVKSVVN